MIHIYCGDGKGKTTAAVGLAARMLGTGGRVHIVQFLKGNDSSEIDFLKNCAINSNVTISRCDKNYGFYKNMSDIAKKEITNCHNKNLTEALEMLSKLDMLVLDEIFAALRFNLADMSIVKEIINSCHGVELILTGREPQEYFIENADYISEIKKVRHPYDKGIKARKGIEF